MAERIKEALNPVIDGSTEGELLVVEQSFSFWGGIDPETGKIIDLNNPQYGISIKDKIIAMPGIIGSTAGPGALLACLYKNTGPRAIILEQLDASPISAIVAAQACDIRTPPLFTASLSKLARFDQQRVIIEAQCISLA